jgi:hypothetical protein
MSQGDNTMIELCDDPVVYALSWDDAPKWANWLAMEANGKWYWYADKPMLGDNIWISLGRFLPADPSNGWQKTLQQRPPA